MKKIIISLCIATFAVCSFSCKKCVTCIEADTHTTADFCGTSKKVKAFEDDLKTEGAKYGQYWSCVDKITN